MVATSTRNFTQELFVEFGVSSEDQLEKLLYQDAMKIPCIYCKREFEADKLFYPNDDPVCKDCL
jgi:CCR4-NOT transcriptional regulation complex NOT5 subunit